METNYNRITAKLLYIIASSVVSFVYGFVVAGNGDVSGFQKFTLDLIEIRKELYGD